MLMELPYPDVGNLTWGWLGPLLLLLVLDVDLETQASAVSDILEVVLCCQSHFILSLQNQNQNSNKCLHSHQSPCLPLLKRIWPWALINSGRSYNCTDLSTVTWGALVTTMQSSQSSEQSMIAMLCLSCFSPSTNSVLGFLSDSIVESLTRLLHSACVMKIKRRSLYFVTTIDKTD